LYQAAIDYLSDRNIISANYEGGDIITDWCQKSPQDTQREVKVTILITGDKISKESLLVKAFSRLKKSQENHKEEKELADEIAEAVIKKVEADF
jgi:hypothetical protein